MRIIGTLCFVCIAFISLRSQRLSLAESEVSFDSDAPLEYITAALSTMDGVLDLSSGEFAFKVMMRDFQGFNNSLQRIHFLENYIEESVFPTATFVGYLVDPIDLEAQTAQLIRVKGQLNIHGQTEDFLIDVMVRSMDDGFAFDAQFVIELADFEIDIPRIVEQKISEQIEIDVKGKFQ